MTVISPEVAIAVFTCTCKNVPLLAVERVTPLCTGARAAAAPSAIYVLNPAWTLATGKVVLSVAPAGLNKNAVVATAPPASLTALVATPMLEWRMIHLAELAVQK